MCAAAARQPADRELRDRAPPDVTSAERRPASTANRGRRLSRGRTTTATRSARSSCSAPRRRSSGTPRPSFRQGRRPSCSREGSRTATTCGRARSPASPRSWTRSPGSPSEGGLVLGICNGFQILTEAGLLAGVLRPNASLSFVCRDVGSGSSGPTPPFTSRCRLDRELTIPVKHGEGCWYADPDLLDELESRGQIVLRYAAGDNPNGAVADVAGVCNEDGKRLRTDAASRARGRPPARVDATARRSWARSWTLPEGWRRYSASARSRRDLESGRIRGQLLRVSAAIRRFWRRPEGTVTVYRHRSSGAYPPSEEARSRLRPSDAR